MKQVVLIGIMIGLALGCSKSKEQAVIIFSEDEVGAHVVHVSSNGRLQVLWSPPAESQAAARSGN